MNGLAIWALSKLNGHMFITIHSQPLKFGYLRNSLKTWLFVLFLNAQNAFSLIYIYYIKFNRIWIIFIFFFSIIFTFLKAIKKIIISDPFLLNESLFLLLQVHYMKVAEIIIIWRHTPMLILFSGKRVRLLIYPGG